MPAHWILDVTDAMLERALGVDTFERGLQYFDDGRVRSVGAPVGRSVTGLVAGTRTRPYQVVVAVQPPTPGAGLRINGLCNCPMVMNCKHVAAVLLAARDQVAGSATVTPIRSLPAWEQRLSPLLASRVVPGSPVVTELAVQFELVVGTGRRGHGPGDRIRVRPLLQGRSGKWVKTGASFDELNYPNGYRGRTFRPDQQQAVSALNRLAKAHRHGYYGYGESPVHLDELGPHWWELITDLVATDVTLIDTTRQPVRVEPDPARVRLLAKAANGVQLTPSVTIGDRAVAAADLLLIGDPATALVELGSDGFVLARLSTPIPESVADLVQSGPIAIPAADLDRFRTGWLPRLAAAIEIESPDGALVLPKIGPPRLALAVTYRPDHRTQLQWSFAYPVDDRLERMPLRSLTDPLSIRDPRAESTLLQRLPLDPQLVDVLTDDQGLRPECFLVGLDTAVLADRALDALRGADVLVDVTGAPAPYRLSLSAPVITSTVAESDRSDWYDLDVTLTIDGEKVPFAPLFAALAASSEHVLLDSGTYFAIDRPEFDQLRRLIEEARALQDRPAAGLRISPHQAGLWEDLVELGVVGSQSAAWQRQVSALLALDSVPAPAPPAALRADLRPYQLTGFQWLDFLWANGLGGVLADDMGLGKTVQLLAAICRAVELGRSTAPVLVVAPTSVVGNWAAEARKFAPDLQVVTISETAGRRGLRLAELTGGADLVVTSYALFRIEFDQYQDRRWSALILDEAQVVKNHQAKGYQCARQLSAPVKFVVTGTPLENNLMELWAMLSIAAPGMFPSPQKFSDFYRKPIERGDDPALAAQLRRRIRPLMLRRTKGQVATDLPAKQEQLLEVALNDRHRKIYQTHLQRERQKVLGLLDDLQRNRFEILRSLTLLRRLALDPALIDERHHAVGSAKIDVLTDHLTELAGEGHRALVFSQFTGFLRLVRNRLETEKLPYCYLDGRTRNRPAVIEYFKSGAAPVFLISLKAGGFGLNLTEADYCFILDPWWNPAVESQAVDRTHRIGQTRQVMVYRMLATDTIEAKVMDLQQRKRELFARMIDGDAGGGAAMTVADIRSLLD